MPFELIAEDGTGRADANSYASRAEFAAFAEAHLYAGAHATATDARRDVALVMATRVINTHVTFNGAPASSTQALDWPRAGVVPDPPPKRLKDATCELALDLLSGNRLAEPQEKGIAELGLGQGAIQIKFAPDDRRQPLPDTVVALLAPLATIRRGNAMVRTRRTY